MTIETALAELKSSIGELSTRVKQVALAVRQAAFKSEDADLLEGASIATVRSELQARSVAHVTRTDNPHNETAESIGAPSTAYIQSEIDKLIPSGILPIGRYGNQTFMPAPASGGIEGTIRTYSPGRAAPGMIENDGTYVFLAACTDGETIGVYYNYIENVRLLNPSQAKIIRTVRRYRPSFIPQGSYVSHIQCRLGNMLMGFVSNAQNNVTHTFISFMKGSMDDSTHTGILIANTGNEAWADGNRQNVTPVLMNDGLYFIHRLSGYLTFREAAQFRISFVSNSALANNGSVVTPTQITGWNCEGFTQNYSAQANVLLAQFMTSNNANENPAILIQNAGNTYNILHGSIDTFVAIEGRKLRIRVYGGSYIVNALASSQSPNASFSFVIDLDAKTAVVDDMYKGQSTVDANSAASINANKFHNLGNAVEAIFLHALIEEPNSADLRVFIPQSQYVQADFVAHIFKKVDNRTLFDQFKDNETKSLYERQAWFGAPISYPTALGEKIFGAIQLPNKGLLVSAIGTRANGETYESLVFARYAGTPDNLIGSVYSARAGTTIRGFKQTNERWFLEDRGFNIHRYIGAITHVDSNGIRNYGTQFNDLYSKYTAIDAFDENLAFSGVEWKIDPNVLGDRRDKLIIARGVALNTVTSSTSRLIIPREGNAKPILAAHWSANGVYGWALANVDITVNATTGQVTIGELDATTVMGGQSNLTSLGIGASYVTGTGQQVFYDAGSGDILMGGSFPGVWSYIGDTHRSSFKVRINRTTGKLVAGTALLTSTTARYQQYDYLATPEDGFGVALTLYTLTDDWTKYVFTPIGKTTAEFDAFNTSAKAKQVLLTLRPATGWNLYFNEPAPLFIAGANYTLPAQTLDLSKVTADPSNKTFYVYGRLVLGVPEYLVSLTELPDTETTMFIGTVTTDNSAIVAINVVKVDRIGTYRISDMPVGSAIPSSGGHPADATPLLWK